jgi:hypothetical protein
MCDAKRVFSEVRGMPSVLAARFENCVLSREGVTGNCPCTAPARARSAAPGRTIFALLTPARPKSPARILDTALVYRALRNAAIAFTFTTPAPWNPP